MSSSPKLQDIDQKIKDLQERKKYLEQKHLEDLAKLVKKTEAHLLPSDILAGALLHIKEAFHNHDPQLHLWQQQGQTFLTQFKKNKEGGKNNKETFRQPAITNSKMPARP